MQSEQCYRQRCKQGRGGRDGLGWWGKQCASSAVLLWRGAGAGGGGKKPRQALKARRLRHAERTVLPAVAQRRKGGRPGRSRVVGAAGCGVGGVGVSVGGASGGGLECGGGTTSVGRDGGVPFRAALRGPRAVWCARGGGGSKDNGPELGPRCVVGGGVRIVGGVSCGGVGVCPATEPFTTRKWRGSRGGTEAGKPGEGNRGAGGGLSPAGMTGVPSDPVGAEAPHVGWVRNYALFFRHRSS